ncbi:AlpA family transcriptional regulator [Vogesella sp. DC21W]|jgi:prophage regulatory protein|uniref:AlpA family transcriptional regulator n=1 Tax=Vogesella aquatica TaxID=2984206 RepID=A0ABT5IUW6_9NEIS|nr:AlpA family transcriptional regulator [Vogesella aquatica]MBP7178688.1 AlpA family transcriptional regulator [Moraxellaceae bacterium]MDC7715986.1 AlpA family transcriptional regulator [Vogesella aquatica]
MKILRIHDVMAMIGLARSTIYKYIGEGHFPKQIRLGRRAVGWLLSDIERWLRMKVAER